MWKRALQPKDTNIHVWEVGEDREHTENGHLLAVQWSFQNGESPASGPRMHEALRGVANQVRGDVSPG